jgi:predicted short-subunit dehydrogenase-like oxidoreductase (DUF2520 family)
MRPKCYSARVPARPRITIVGAGRLGRALALQLAKAKHSVAEIVHRPLAASKKGASALARRVGARAVPVSAAELDAGVVWLCVPDREIAAWARKLAPRTQWKGKIVFHSSGALSSDELSFLRNLGAVVASVHPFMTFVQDADPSLKGVGFALEGDSAAVRMAESIVRDLGGEAFRIRRDRKPAYHAFGGFVSPLFIALLTTAEQVAREAGIPSAAARRRMLPILRRTLENYEKFGPAAAFTGPIVRGDAAVVSKHLHSLKSIPEARDVYLALARSALRHLPTERRNELTRALNKK